MAGRRDHRKRVKKLRHRLPRERTISAPMVAYREADRVKQLTYTRRQAAEALGLSLSTIDRRVVPAITTVLTEWGTRLIPVSELERYLAERTEPARPERAKQRRTGRPAAVSDEIGRRIESEHGRGKSLGQIARELNASGAPTAQGGRCWWPSTVRSILVRRAR